MKIKQGSRRQGAELIIMQMKAPTGMPEDHTTTYVFTADGDEFTIGISNYDSDVRIFDELREDTGYVVAAQIPRRKMTLLRSHLPGADNTTARYFRLETARP